MENGTYLYDLEMSTPLGPRRGNLELIVWKDHTIEQKAMKQYSVIHLGISVVVMVVLAVLCKSIGTMLLIYTLVMLFMPKIVEVIGNIGFYATDRDTYWIDGTEYTEYGHFTKFYGPLSALMELGLYVVGCSVPLAIMYLTLPQSVYIPVTAFTALFLVFHFVIHPLIRDIVWILSHNDPEEILDALHTMVTVGIVIVGIIVTVLAAGITAKNAQDRLDMNAVLERYFAQSGQNNPYRDMDMSDAEVDFSKLSTKAKLVFDRQIASDSGVAYPGSEMTLEYSMANKEWKVLSHHFTGNPMIVSDAVYVGENQLEIGGYSGLAKIEITVLSKTDDGGHGIFRIIDKPTDTEVYSSPFTFSGYSFGYEYVANISFEKPLNLGPWEVYEEDFTWVTNEHIYLYMNTRDFDLYLQE